MPEPIVISRPEGKEIMASENRPSKAVSRFSLVEFLQNSEAHNHDWFGHRLAPLFMASRSFRQTYTQPMSLRSCLYECKIMHHRLQPKVHQFNYELFYFALDLDEVDTVAKTVWGFARNRWNLYEFRDRDHLTLPGMQTASVKANVLAWMAQQGHALPVDTRVILVTLPRVLGYIFNPVSFYFCSDAAGSPVGAVVQVGNTFREMKPYLLPQPTRENFYQLVTPKHFYVSPFSPLDLSFDFKLRVPDEHLDLHIDDRQGDELILMSALSGPRCELTSARLAWLTLKFPFVTLKVIMLIHWQALRLWWKGLPFIRKGAQPELQQDVYHPHRH